MMFPDTAVTDEPGAGNHLSILVGAPDPLLRQRLASALRLQGHEVLEAADAQDMRLRLHENTERTGKPLDLILCGGLFAEKEDAELAQRLASPGVTRALVLIPSGGFLSTATRAQRLRATAVLEELPVVKNLWDILRKAAGGDALANGRSPQRGGSSLLEMISAADATM